MFEGMKWTETAILGVLAALLPIMGAFVKDLISVFHSRLSHKQKESEIEAQKEKEGHQALMEITRFLEERNEFLTNKIDVLRTEKDDIMRELYKTREDKIRLEVRSEFRMQMVRNGEKEFEAYQRVSEIDAFSLSDADPIVISDDDKRVFTASKPALDLLGYDDASEIKHRSIDELFPGFHAVAFKAGVIGSGFTLFRGEKKAAIIGKPMKVAAIKKTGEQFQVNGVLRTWTDGSRLFYAFVIEDENSLAPKEPELTLPAPSSF